MRYGGGIHSESGAHPVGQNLILWGNTGLGTSGQIYDSTGTFATTYSCIQDGFGGVGNIQSNPAFVVGPEGNFYLSQIAAGQSQQSPCVDAGDPASPMIIGTTRTDGVQDADVIDMGYHYPLFTGSSPVSIILTPVNPPIIIPPQGGSFDWNIILHNGESTPQAFDVWTIITLPGGSTRPGWGPFLNLTMPAGATINRVRTQNITDRYPAGNYTYTANVGDHPSVIWDSDSFPFTKAAAGDGGWARGESNGDGMAAAAKAVPESYTLGQNHPNPFNPITTISYGLPEDGWVKLAVYDLLGRELEVLVDGYGLAGYHEATFNASGLAAGIYIYRLTAGDFSEVKKMMLVK